MTGIKYTFVPEGEIPDYIDEIVPLRSAFFAEYPYLQDPNDMEFQRGMVGKCLNITGAYLLLAKDGEKIAAASIGAPLVGAVKYDNDASRYRKFFFQTKTKPEDFIQGIWTLSYPEYRRSGVTSMFGAMLIDRFTQAGYKGRLMKNIVRPSIDPKAPEGFSPSSEFFLKKRGYVRIPVKPEITEWTDIGDDKPTEKAFEYYVNWLSK